LVGLHYSGVLALHALGEPSDLGVVQEWFGASAEQFARLSRISSATASSSTPSTAGIRPPAAFAASLGARSGEDYDRYYRLLYYAARLRRPGSSSRRGVRRIQHRPPWAPTNGTGRRPIDVPATTPIADSTTGMRFTALPTGAPGWIVPDGLRDRWTLRLGDSATPRPWLAELGRVDFFFRQHAHGALTREFVSVWPRLAAGACC
jgi:hypothetical protein